MGAVLNAEIKNSTDATRGQPLALRVLTRASELEDALAACDSQDVLLRTMIETALATVHSLLNATASDAVTQNLKRWLDRNQHLAQRHR